MFGLRLERICGIPESELFQNYTRPCACVLCRHSTYSRYKGID